MFIMKRYISIRDFKNSSDNVIENWFRYSLEAIGSTSQKKLFRGNPAKF